MYPAIIFFLALFVSWQALHATVIMCNQSNNTSDQGRRALRLDLMSCLLWAWLFYLLH